MSDITAKRISELQEATNITDRDLLVINEFSDQTGYTLTKKIKFGTLANKILTRNTSDQYSALELKELAHYDYDDLLAKFMTAHSNRTDISSTLALSTEDDLNLKDLAHMDNSDLSAKLDKYVLKSKAFATFTGKDKQYVTGIYLQDGVITNVQFASLEEKVPTDTTLNAGSGNPVTNAAITAALSGKVDKSYATVSYSAEDGKYIDTLSLKDGKVIIHKASLPTYPVDNTLDSNSTNPVLNKVITAKFTSLESGIKSDASSTYVKKTEANATFTAGNSQYIRKITLTEGRITDVQYGTIPTQLTVDSSMSTTSTNPVQNKVIAARFAEIESKQTDITSTLDKVYPIGSIYLTTTNSCPLQTLGIGTWEKVGAGRCLWGGSGTNAGQTIEAGLPNIYGKVTGGPGDDEGPFPGKCTATGAFSTWRNGSNNGSYGSSNYGAYDFDLDASRSSSIYGNSTTVLPPAYIVNVYRRTR